MYFFKREICENYVLESLWSVQVKIQFFTYKTHNSIEFAALKATNKLSIEIQEKYVLFLISPKCLSIMVANYLSPLSICAMP